MRILLAVILTLMAVSKADAKRAHLSKPKISCAQLKDIESKIGREGLQLMADRMQISGPDRERAQRCLDSKR